MFSSFLARRANNPSGKKNMATRIAQVGVFCIRLNLIGSFPQFIHFIISSLTPFFFDYIPNMLGSQVFFPVLWNYIIMETFGERLKNLRLEKKVGQIELAKALGVGKSIISLWERNECEPTLSKLILLAKYFDVSIDYLAGLEI